MLQNISGLTCKIGENLHHFICDPKADFSEIKEALFQFVKQIGLLEEQKSQQEQQSKEAALNNQSAELVSEKEV